MKQFSSSSSSGYKLSLSSRLISSGVSFLQKSDKDLFITP